jgi:hypothetical protein
MTNEALLARATAFRLNGTTTLELRSDRGGKKKWAIVDNGVLNKKGDWEYEPLPSSRDDAFLERTRFDSIEEALQVAKLGGVILDGKD